MNLILGNNVNIDEIDEVINTLALVRRFKVKKSLYAYLPYYKLCNINGVFRLMR